MTAALCHRWRDRRKRATRQFTKFIPLTKVDEEQRIVYGLVTAEAPDQDNEVMDYATTAPYYEKLRDKFLKTTDGKSLAPLREMHQLSAVGAGKDMDFDDEAKAIHMGFKVVDDNAWTKVKEGVYTGFSQGGRYVKTWKKGSLTYYTADPGEISLVDNPCLPTATFEYVKSSGAVELRKFRTGATDDDHQIGVLVDRLIETVELRLAKGAQAEELAKDKKTKRVAGEDLPPSAFAYVGDSQDTSTWKLPIEFSTEAKTKSHIRNALARFSQTQGIPDGEKAKVKSKLKAAAKKHGIEVSDEAEKIFALYKFLHSDALRKGMYDVKDLADVMCTLAFVQSCLAQEREYEGDASTVPEDLLQVMEDLQQVYLELVQEETSEMIEHARSLIGGEKTMKPDTLEKALAKMAAHAKAMHKLRKMIGDQHDATVDMHKTHHSDMIASKDHGAAKALATDHLGKAIAFHAGNMSKAYDHIDKTLAEMDDAMPPGGEIADESVASSAGQNALVPGAGVGTEAQEHKALTVADVQMLLTQQAAGFEKRLEAALDANTTNVLKALFAAETGGGVMPSPGIGDRSQVGVTKVHQTHPVKKVDDSAPGAGAGAADGSQATTITVEDSRKAFQQGDNDAMLKLARSIKPNPSGVPAMLQGHKLISR